MGANMLCPALQLSILLIFIPLVWSQNGMPVWDTKLTDLKISENAKPGDELVKLVATIPNGDPVIYSVTSEFFTLFGNRVFLTRKLDHEANGEATLVIFRATNAVDTKLFNEQKPLVKILDENDELPVWSETTFSVDLPENSPVDTTIVDSTELRVEDVDDVNDPLTVTCDVKRLPDKNDDVCDIFEIKRTSVSRKHWEGIILLKKPLNYETRQSYQIPLVAFDGLRDTLLSVEVRILDIQDSPPIWIKPKSIRESEEIANFTMLHKYVAVDGDTTKIRQIHYKIIYDTAESRLFHMNEITGELYNLIKLDKEAYPFRNLDTVSLKLLAMEKDVDTGELGLTLTVNATELNITIQIDDINDNKPLFTKTSYVLELPEGEQNETPLDGANLSVTDDDVDDLNNNFVLTLSNYNAEFDLSLTEGKFTLSTFIRVRNSALIDYEAGPKQYNFKVIAREVRTKELFSSTADITVNILDINDNNPQFVTATHTASVSETYQQPAAITTIAATDVDTGLMGTAGIVYKLSGAGSNLFRIDKDSGEVFVEPCATPGRGNCIDYDNQQKQFLLTVTATDEKGSGNLNRTTLLINVLDVNDNAPEFQLKDYHSIVDEGQTSPSPSIIVSATDVDTVGGPVKYTIASDPTNIWLIDTSTGRITARKPVFYTDTVNDQGFFTLLVQASDGKHIATSDVNIDVITEDVIVTQQNQLQGISVKHYTFVRMMSPRKGYRVSTQGNFCIQQRNRDINNFAPEFIGTYEVSINETTRGGKSIISVTARDGDAATHANGKIDYKITDGTGEKFVMFGQEVRTRPDATFDYDIKNKYVMTIQARDQGTPSKSGTVSLTVHILDMNNKDPYIDPDTQRTSVYENAFLDQSIYTVTAKDNDANAKLEFFFIEPKSATSGSSLKRDVDRKEYDFTTLFKINKDTGVVRVNGTLDRDKTSFLIFTVKVVDVNASPQQTGTGLLFIEVLEYNLSPPYFLPYTNITVDEEQQTGTFVTAIQARDIDNAISQYLLIDNPFDHFSINFKTGSISINKPLDFEVIESTSFEVQAFDDGIPQLSNKTRVYVNVRNINDNLPRCGKTIYTSEIKEHSPGQTPIIKVSATDNDKGDYGVVRFRIDDPRFTIDPIKGDITVAANKSDSLDREKEERLVIQVTVTDSPQDPSVAKFTICSVYVDLEDINDNGPVFRLTKYETTILETTPVQTSILQLVADDLDIGKFGVVAYSKIDNTGDPDDYFSVAPRSGIISVAKNLLNKEGTYRFDVKAVDEDGTGPHSAKVGVEIIVLEAFNSLPVWVKPPNDNMTIPVLEEQYDGMLVYQASATDEDSGDNGRVDYHIFENGVHKSCTKEFCINRITGVIFANRVYDREEQEHYTILLTARDNGKVRLEITRYLSFVILDVNDNKPEFQRAADGSILPLDIEVKENTKTGTVVGRVQATDRDKDPKIYYFIINGNEGNYFQVNVKTGDIILAKTLDREERSVVTLSIQATNNITDYTVIRSRRRRATDPSIINVKILVGDTNDASPVFTQNTYHGCIAKTSPVGQSILRVEAKDQDSTDVKYSILSGNTNDAFSIEETRGILSNKVLMQESSKTIYEMKVEAKDASLKDTTNAVVFVTEKTDGVVAVLTQPASEVRKFISEIQRSLMAFTDSSGRKYFRFVCFSSITDHVLDNGDTTSLWTDVTFYAVCENCIAGQVYHVHTGNELLRQLNALKIANKDGFDLLYIKHFKLLTDETSLTDRTPVLVVLIIIIVLFLLIIAFLIITCYCIRKSNKRHKAILASQRRDDWEEETNNVNPMYDNYGFNPEPAGMDIYAKPHKPPQEERPRKPDPIVVPPVLIPEPEPQDEEPEPVIIDHVETEYVPEFISDPPSPKSEELSIPDDTFIETELVDNRDDVSTASNESEFRIETTLENPADD